MSRERAKGTAWETAVTRWLHAVGWTDARRTGSAEFGRGDISIPSLRIAVECKAVAKIELGAIAAQCRGIRERNADLVAVVACVKRRGSTSPADAYWIADGPNLLGLLAGVRAEA